MQAARSKTVQWDPHPNGSNRFIVGSPTELRLYSYDNSKSTPTISTLSTLTDLPSQRTFAWSPHSAFPDLVALGTTTGRTLLLRLDATSSPSVVLQAESGIANPKLGAVQINVRHTRPCNVVCFAGGNSGLLAVGLEKARGESLLVYDIETAARGLDNTTRTTTGGGLRSSSTGTNSHPEPPPLHQYGSSETVSSAAFISPHLLVAGMAQKYLRVFDIRSSSTSSPIQSYTTRSINEIKSNPFDSNQFISWGEDSQVRLWDIRRGGDAIMSWSESDAASRGVGRAGSGGIRPIAEVNWHPSRRGVVGVLEKEGTTVRVWNILEGPLPTNLSNPSTSTHDPPSSTNPNNFNDLPLDPTSLENKDTSESSIRFPYLFSDYRTRPFHFSLSSFSFLNNPSSHLINSFVGVTKDSHPGTSSGHRIEFVEGTLKKLSKLSERKLLVVDPSSSLSEPAPSIREISLVRELRTEDEYFGSPDDEDLEDDEGVSNNGEEDNEEVDDTMMASVMTELANPQSRFARMNATNGNGSTVRGRSRTLVLPTTPSTTFDRNETPKPGGGGGGAGVANGNGEVGNAVAGRALERDMIVVLRDRVDKGYGGNPTLNATLVDSSLQEFWRWIARAESLSLTHSHNHDYDFRFRGVLSLLLSFPPSTTPTPSHRPKLSHQHNQHTIYNEFHRSIRRGDEQQAQAQAYISAVVGMVGKRKLDKIWVGIGGNLIPQRKLGLQACGEEWVEDSEEVAGRLSRAGNNEEAARHAFFSGHLEKAMHHLKNCENMKLRLLAPVVAAYLSSKDAMKGSDSVYAELCRSLSSDVETPWIRAMFAFLASGGDWRELVDETGLQLRDRVAVALRFLPDSELVPFLQGLASEAILSCDLEAVVLLGLRGDGLKLISNYVDRTADVQTAALASSFICPGLLHSSRLGDRWIQTYRQTLNQLQLYGPRALFDSAQGKRARAAMEQARVAGRNQEFNMVKTALRKAAPVQMLVRCQFCSTTISGREGEKGGAQLGVRTDLCPNCGKTLPGCSICLQAPSIHNFAADGSSSLCWCQNCRHGGHVAHILEWFEKFDVCAVSSCDCRCRGLL